MKLKKLLHKERWRFSSEARKVDTLCSWAGSEPWRMWGGRATNLSRQPDGVLLAGTNQGWLQRRRRDFVTATQAYKRADANIRVVTIDCQLRHRLLQHTTMMSAIPERETSEWQFWTDHELWTCFDIWHLTADNIHICLKSPTKRKTLLLVLEGSFSCWKFMLAVASIGAS